MKINILTQFPEMFAPITSESILGRAVDNGILEINIINIRDYSTDKHNRTDDTPFGGGAGMVMLCQPAFDALKDLKADGKRILYMSPRGRMLDQGLIEELSKEIEITILCGHYEGIDQRIIDHCIDREYSIGDYILTGGELPAMVLMDCVMRFAGALGNEASHDDESFYDGMLEYPQYTRPADFRGMKVPEVLLNGNHKLIKEWQQSQSLERTKRLRPDLLEK